MPCREHLSQLRQHSAQLAERNVEVCVVTFDAGPLSMAYVRDTDLPWPLLVDEDRTLYRAYGMHLGNWWNVLGPPAIGVYLKLLWRGRRLKQAGRDVHQLGGHVLIDPQGIVKTHHVGAGPADRPEASELLERIGP
ncbi:MAG: SelL-related redox protein [Planctomycetota bacterium]